MREQIRLLLQIKNYRRLLMHELQHRRARASTRDDPQDFMSDIYDSPRWNEVAGAMENGLSRIVLHMCVDGVPAFGKQQSKNVGSVKPMQYFVANLAPWLRYRKTVLWFFGLICIFLDGSIFCFSAV